MTIKEFKDYLNTLDEETLQYNIYLSDVYKTNIEDFENVKLDSSIVKNTSEEIKLYKGLYLTLNKTEIGIDDICLVPQNYEIRKMEEY